MQEKDLISEQHKALSSLTLDIEDEENCEEESEPGCLEKEAAHDDENPKKYGGGTKMSYCCNQSRFLDNIMDKIQNQMSKTNKVFQEIDSGLNSMENKLTFSIQNAKMSVEEQYSINNSKQERISAQLKQSHSEVFKLRQAVVVNAMSEGKAVGKKTEWKQTHKLLKAS